MLLYYWNCELWDNQLWIWIKIQWLDSFFLPEWSKTEKETRRLKKSPGKLKEVIWWEMNTDAMSQPTHVSLPLGTWRETFQRIILIPWANGRGQNSSHLIATCIPNIISHHFLLRSLSSHAMEFLMIFFPCQDLLGLFFAPAMFL